MDNDARNAAYQAALKETAQQAERVKVLARSPLGIPVSGAVTLLRNDPLIQGPKLFAKNCASCHRYEGNDGRGNRVKDAQSASDLAGIRFAMDLTGGIVRSRTGSAAWVNLAAPNSTMKKW